MRTILLFACFVLTSCQAIVPTKNGYAVATILTNSRQISASKSEAMITGANVSNPIGTALSGAASLAVPGAIR